MKDFVDKTIENILQIITILLQCIGIFLLKPDVLNPYNKAELFAGGNLYNFILIFITVIFIYLSYTLKKRTYATKWFITFIVFGFLFIFSFYFYNKAIEDKTIVFNTENTESVRYVKGNKFNSTITPCANALKLKNPDITDLEIIKNCADITDATELVKIWPENDIRQNFTMISILYCIAISVASITLVCGLQALKCRRIKV